MKFLQFNVMLCAFLLNVSLAFAQTSKTVERGAMLDLTAETGASKYQWQVSSDGIHFINLPQATTPNYCIKVYAPAFYRVAMSSTDNTISYGEVTNVLLSPVTYNENVSESSGAHGFVEDKNGMSGSGIKIPEDRNGDVAGVTASLTEWTNGGDVAVSYIYHPNDIVDTRMDINVKPGTQANFRLDVFDPNDLENPLASTYLTVAGANKTQNVFLVGLKFPHDGYYRYVLECLSGWNNIKSIDKLYHNSPSPTKSYKSGYLSSPSVRLSNWRSTDSKAPRENAYNWCYQEVMMPEESDIPGTYVMSLGVLRGYMGIQMNGYLPNGQAKHDVIFSMWDDGDTDKNPNLPEHLRSKIVDISPIAISERFGNEGTGIKSFASGHLWECGKFIQFITNCRTEMATYEVVENGKKITKQQENTLVSAWFNAQDGKGWQYISTIRLANQHKRFDSWYSFLENFDYTSGQFLRKGFYRNGYACTSEGEFPKWYHFNKVDFSHTDGGTKEGNRNDYGQGVTPLHQGKNGEVAFFMTNGGFVEPNVTSSVVPLNSSNIAVDTINLDVLLNRVDQAVAKEQYAEVQNEYIEKRKLNSSFWKVIDFSSEEADGEGTNGNSSLVIDGNKDTYWHSAWKSYAAKCPHYITIDMTKEVSLDAVKITMSGGSHRFMKAFNLYVGNEESQVSTLANGLDNIKWKKVYSTENAPNQASFNVFLKKPVKGKYFKIEVTKSRADDGDFVRINEIEFFGQNSTPPELSKNNWRVIKFSNQETTGEGNYGRASQIIDGRIDTYWHSAWQSGTATNPQSIVVDMNQLNVIEGMQIIMRGGADRYVKAFNFYTSEDNVTWNKVHSDTDAPSRDVFSFILSSSVQARYFKFEVLSSRDKDGVLAQINEINVLGRGLSPSEKMMCEAEELLTDPNAGNVGSPAKVHYMDLQSAFNALSLAVNGFDEGVNMTRALNVYKTTSDINMPEPNVIYTLTSEGRGSMMADEKTEKLQSTKHSSTNVKDDYKDVKQQFAFVQKNGKMYLYSCFFKKYMTSNVDVLSDEPKDPIFMIKHTGYKGRVFMNFGSGKNLNFGGSNQILVDGWSQPDAGNAFLVEKVGVISNMNATDGVLNMKNLATFSAPFNVVPEEGVAVYYATLNADKSALMLNRVIDDTIIPANTGLIVASDGLTSARFVKVEGQSEVADLSENVLRNSANDEVVMSEGDYILTRPADKSLAFYKATVGSQLEKYHAYLHLDDASADSIRMFVVGEATGIGMTDKENSHQNLIYDLSGRVVHQVVVGGIYIQNGKKFIAK